ncbi:AAA-like domain-containing protein [Enterovibrio norvegicus]|uniref:AAA-like domain-containing protein n=1 Tax=Enterovibrio norvegicus TaxID=188144 RepID=UPI0035545D52
MNRKILKKYTTIPSHLYVERSADKQLRDIIEEMQRPGYVLVARQMGKTNLLFNAKRNLESEFRKFVYIDLSNNFPTERACYEFIIDSIFDVLDDDLWEIRPNVDKINERTITDHVFYTKSLLTILKHLNKDLVLILDEIDALRTSEYSDNIFAVIRSNYFTRSNFPEFENLTYILSGVIEPKDLIKDRNKSPFNIGEKIYLDDFSRKEFSDFVAKGKLKINSDVEDHIFQWTQGNPRLTFDICSDIESVIIDTGSIDANDIDNLIKRKYLTTFDIAPIDHIRELVSDEKDIQDAVEKIQSKEISPDISDKIKSKLYLYGIISSTEKDCEIKIKNPIISKSLSLNWIKSLSDNPSLAVDKAIALIEKSLDFHEAIELITSALDQIDETDKTLRSVALFYLGYAEHSIGEYEKSNIHLLESPFTINASPFLHFRSKLFIGLNYYQLKQYDLGSEMLEYVVDKHSNTLTWANATLNLAINIGNSEKSIELLTKIIDDNVDIPGDIETQHEADHTIKIIQSYAYYYLSTLTDNIETGFNYLDKAIELGVEEHIPFLMLLKNTALKDSDDMAISTIIAFILSNQLKFTNSNNNYSTISYNYKLHIIIARTCFQLDPQSFIKLLNYSISDLNVSEDNFYYDVANSLEDASIRTELLDQFFHKNTGIVQLRFYRLYILSLIKCGRSIDIILNDYVNLLSSQIRLELEDMSILSLVIKTSIEETSIKNIPKHVTTLEPLVINIDEELKFDSSILLYWLFQYSISLEDEQKTKFYGREVLNCLSTSKSESSIIDNEIEKIIKTHVMKTLRNIDALTATIPIRNKHHYGRNDILTVKYKNGNIVKAKFKKLKDEINSGECEVILDL